MSVFWLERALNDLEGIETYIEKNNPVAARHMEQQIKRAVSLLNDQPMIGRSGRAPGMRELIVTGTPYIVAYAIEANDVYILSVIHGARKWPYAFE